MTSSVQFPDWRAEILVGQHAVKTASVLCLYEYFDLLVVVILL